MSFQRAARPAARASGAQFFFESLEARSLLSASPGNIESVGALSGGFCRCPICCGDGLASFTAQSGSVSESSSPAASLASLPLLSSNSTAAAKLYLDFNGDFQSTWGAWTNATTPAYDRDGDATSFSAAELAGINEIWARVAEDFAPFNIDVTTVAPGSLAERVVAHIAIGGNGSWYGSGAGGVAYVGGFYNSSPNVGYVFEDNLNSPQSIAEAASHEAGHLFGLSHQAEWNGTNLVRAYSQGNADWAPIMGTGYYSARTTWHNGATNTSSTSLEDNVAILSNASNGFGMRADDFGNTIQTASNLPLSGNSVTLAGLIGRRDDADVWQFSTSGGSARFALAAAALGANLDGILELRDAGGNLLASSNPSGSFNAEVTFSLASGTYFLVARSDGAYGNMGQYTVTGSLTASAIPDISVLVDGDATECGETVDFGQAAIGGTIDKTFTVRNTGTDVLSLSMIDAESLPAGFTIVANLGDTELSAGESTQFIVRFSPTVLADYGGALDILSNDGDEGTFTIWLAGELTLTSWGSIDFFLATNRQVTGNNWFSVSASRSGFFTAEAYFAAAAGNVDIAIYDANYQLLASSATSGDSERLDVIVAAGDQLFIGVSGVNPSVTFRCTNLVSADGDTIEVVGTASDDLYVFLPGAAIHRVAVNGVGYDFDAATYCTVHFHDPGGVDTLVAVGSALDETAVACQDEVTIDCTDYSFLATGTELVQLYAGPGEDTATIVDRAGNDTFTGSPQSGTMTGAGYSFSAHGFDQVAADFSEGGFDQAFLYGSISDDRFKASPSVATLSSAAFRLEAAGYDTVVGVGGWGNDIALLSDSAGDETFIGVREAGSLSGNGFYLRAANFERVEARSSGGLDVAYLWDSTGDDYFGGSRVLAFLNGLGFSNYVESFDRVTGLSTGGNDTADLYDSTGDDTFVVSGRSRRMESSGYAVQTENFRNVRAYASLGYDRVNLLQLRTTDTIRGRGNWVSLINADTVAAYGFDAVSAFATPGQQPRTDLVAIDYLFSRSGW